MILEKVYEVAKHSAQDNDYLINPRILGFELLILLYEYALYLYQLILQLISSDHDDRSDRQDHFFI